MLDRQWLAVMPLKPLKIAKSRLRGVLSGDAHADLVLAMALDTAAATLACPRVERLVVVSDDAEVRAAMAALGALSVPDQPAAGLNPALRHGARCGVRVAAGTEGDGAADGDGLIEGDGLVAALTADLPALRPAELAEALDTAAALDGPAFVPDAAGTGTVLLTAPSATALAPAFGPASAAAHAAAGAHRLAGRWPGLRRDVDDAADLAEATTLGVGTRTAALLERLRTVEQSTGEPDAGPHVTRVPPVTLH